MDNVRGVGSLSFSVLQDTKSSASAQVEREVGARVPKVDSSTEIRDYAISFVELLTTPVHWSRSPLESTG